MGWNLFDDIKLGLLNLQTAIEFSQPMISLTTWADEASDRNSGESSDNSTNSYSSPSTTTTKRDTPLWGNLDRFKDDSKPEPKQESPAVTPPKAEEKPKEVSSEQKIENTKAEFDNSTDFDYHNFDADFRVFPNEEEDS